MNVVAPECDMIHHCNAIAARIQRFASSSSSSSHVHCHRVHSNTCYIACTLEHSRALQRNCRPKEKNAKILYEGREKDVFLFSWTQLPSPQVLHRSSFELDARVDVGRWWTLLWSSRPLGSRSQRIPPPLCPWPRLGDCNERRGVFCRCQQQQQQQVCPQAATA